MKLFVAFDAYKGCISSKELCRMAKTALDKRDAAFFCVPSGDGGEGTAEALTFGLRPKKKTVKITGKSGKPKNAPYYLLSGTAYLNAADCCGISAENRKEDALLSFTSYGLGELLLAAAKDEDVSEAVVCLGGSGTADGGAGLLAALGAGFYDAFGRKTGYLPGDLDRVKTVDLAPAITALSGKKLTVLCDTEAPLLGENGSVALFAGQKGASSAGKRYLERALGIFARALEEAGARSPFTPHAGAAGGLGFALLCCLTGTPYSGLDYLFTFRDYYTPLFEADAVITGEGFLDGTSFTGKTVGKLATLCEEKGKPLYVVCGDKEPFLPLPSCVKKTYCLRDHASSTFDSLTNARTYFSDCFSLLLQELGIPEKPEEPQNGSEE